MSKYGKLSSKLTFENYICAVCVTTKTLRERKRDRKKEKE